MLKSMGTELPRQDTLWDLLPQRVSSDCRGNREKSFFRCQERRRQCEGNSRVAGCGTRGEGLDSGAVSNWDLSKLCASVDSSSKLETFRVKTNPSYSELGTSVHSSSKQKSFRVDFKSSYSKLCPSVDSCKLEFFRVESRHSYSKLGPSVDSFSKLESFRIDANSSYSKLCASVDSSK